MPEVNLNNELAAILTAHGLSIHQDDEFIYAELPLRSKLKAKSTYTTINNYISSQLDVMVITDNNEVILECFGDFGEDLKSAINKNLANFSSGSLHPLLAALGSDDTAILEQITIEKWDINEKSWMAYIGNISTKGNGNQFNSSPAIPFFESIELAIRSQSLNNRLHWFRGYYLQNENKIAAAELLKDNDTIADRVHLFASLPVIPDSGYHSFRNFTILRQIEE